jgi:hypothetical protein
VTGLLGGCGDAGFADTGPAGTGPAGHAAAALLSLPACDQSRWIGVKQAPACPVAGPGWSTGPLFGAGAPGPLGDFCLYTWGDAGPPQTGSLPTPELRDLEEDCPTVAPQASALDPVLGPALRDAHRARLDAVGSALGAPVTVAVLDTLPHGAPAPRASHGPIMSALVESIACGGPGHPCSVGVAPELALPLVEAGREDPVDGGYFGAPGHLAVAIHRAASGPGPRVLNLSLGWVPDGHLADLVPPNHMSLFHGNGGVAAPVRAVHAAIVHAACHGALVVAAAGNDPVGAGESDPLLPAAWARLEMPDDGACQAAGLGADGLPNHAAPHGVLLAVGGVDLADGPLANARRNATPPLVAPAELAAAQTAGRGTWEVVSGTSVAAAVTSAAAARYWAMRPNEPAGAVMATLYARAEPLAGQAADFCLDAGPCPDVRRLSVCGVDSAAGVARACRAMPAGDPATMDQLDADLAAALVAAPLAGVVRADATQLGAARAAPDCGGTAVGGAGGAGCPAWQASPSAEWPSLVPQPEDPMCPSCVLDTPASTLWMSISPRAPKLKGATLSVSSTTGLRHYALHDLIGLSTLKAGAKVKVGKLPLSGKPYKAWVTFTLAATSGTYARGNAVYVKR